MTRILAYYILKLEAVVKNRKVTLRQRLGAWVVQLGVKIMNGKTLYEIERLEANDE